MAEPLQSLLERTAGVLRATSDHRPLAVGQLTDRADQCAAWLERIKLAPVSTAGEAIMRGDCAEFLRMCGHE